MLYQRPVLFRDRFETIEMVGLHVCYQVRQLVRCSSMVVVVDAFLVEERTTGRAVARSAEAVKTTYRTGWLLLCATGS